MAADGSTHPIEAQAEHHVGAIGGMLPIRELTQITHKGEFIAQHAGHLPDGAVLTINGVAYRLNVVGAAQKAAA